MALALIGEACRQGARLREACRLMGLSIRTVQRWTLQGDATSDGRQATEDKRKPPNALSTAEQRAVLDTLNSPKYRALTPHQTVVQLADCGSYLASESTMYRLLRREEQLTHRALSRPPKPRPIPRLVARGPNEVWSWDITYLHTICKGLFFYLYLLEDIWSRRIMGAAVHDEQTGSHASDLFRQACTDNAVETARLTSHSDNGSPMRGATLLATLQRLGITPSFSRPSVSNDNPYSESLFRTLKYNQEMPRAPFDTIDDARVWVARFVTWYNTEHHHSGIRYVTPDQRHHGREHDILAARHRLYQAARRRHPLRWTGATRNWSPIKEVSINPATL